MSDSELYICPSCEEGDHANCDLSPPKCDCECLGEEGYYETGPPYDAEPEDSY